MFDSLVVTKTQKPGARSLLSLPAALTLHAVLGLGFVLFSLYAPQALPAPPYNMVLWEEKLSIPVTTVDRSKLKEAEQTQPAERPPSRDNELKAPGEVPTTVQDLPPAGPMTGPAGPDVPYGLPANLLNPGEGSTPVPGVVPVLRRWEVLDPPRLVTQVRPEYPPALRMMGVSGKVVLEVMVDENGEVALVTVVSSPHPLLSQAAEEAVRRWKYTRPVSPSGGSARVLQTVVVDFTLR